MRPGIGSNAAFFSRSVAFVVSRPPTELHNFPNSRVQLTSVPGEKSFINLLKEEDFFEVTLASEDTVSLEAHKAILTAPSTVNVSDLDKTNTPNNQINMATLIIYNNLLDVVNTIKESTIHSMSSPTNSPTNWITNKVRATGGRMATVVKALNFDALGVNDDDFELEVASSTRKGSKSLGPLVLDSSLPQEERTKDVAINWLLQLSKVLVEKYNEYAGVINSAFNSIQGQVDKLEEEKEELVRRCDKLELDNDSVRQRSMKGNLIVSSPRQGEVGSRLVRLPREQGGYQGQETTTQMVLRAVEEHSRLVFPLEDVAACHQLGGKDSHTYILKVSNMKPNSTWDTLTSGMMGKKINGSHFNKDNIYFSHQLTPARATFVKEVVKVAHKAKRITGYSTDQNGVTRVCKTLGLGRRWHPVATKEELEQFIRS